MLACETYMMLWSTWTVTGSEEKVERGMVGMDKVVSIKKTVGDTYYTKRSYPRYIVTQASHG
jgi:hypothetical protein